MKFQILFYSFLLFQASMLQAHGFKALTLTVETSSAPWLKLKILYHNFHVNQYRETYYLSKNSEQFSWVYRKLSEGAEFFLGAIDQSLHHHEGENVVFLMSIKD
jgi:hypothetical protein